MRRLIRNPNTGALTPVDTDSNDARGAQALSYNNWAYQQAMQKRQQLIDQSQQDTDLATTKNTTQQAYHALAGALGIDVTPQKDVWDDASQRYIRPKNTAPSFDQLKGKFESLPEDQQGKIYAQGGAQFLDPETGAALLDNLRKTRDTSINKGIDSMFQQITEGKVQYNPQDRKFYRSIDDPNDPLGKKKLQVPITLLEANYINEGMKRGMMFDIDQFGGKGGVASPGNGAAPPPPGVVPPNGLEYPSSSPAGPQFSADPSTRLGEQIRNAFSPQTTNQPNVGDRINDFASTILPDLRNAGAMGVNAVTSGLNTVGRFGAGLADTDAAQIPQIPYEQVQSPLLAAPIRRNAEQATVANVLANPTKITPMGIEPPVDPNAQPILGNVRDSIMNNTSPGMDQNAMMNWLQQRRLGVPLNADDDSN